MTTFSDKANAEMAHAAFVYERAYYHLTSQVGPAVMDELAAAGTLKAAVENVVGQRWAKSLQIGQPLDLAPLGLTANQLVDAAEFREKRAARLAAITPATVETEAPQTSAVRRNIPAPGESYVADAVRPQGTGSEMIR